MKVSFFFFGYYLVIFRSSCSWDEMLILHELVVLGAWQVLSQRFGPLDNVICSLSIHGPCWEWVVNMSVLARDPEDLSSGMSFATQLDCMIPDMSLVFFGPQFPHLCNGYIVLSYYQILFSNSLPSIILSSMFLLSSHWILTQWAFNQP